MNDTSLKSKIISGLFWKFGERITSQMVSFVVSLVLARLLSPAEYGVISIVTVFTVIANVFVVSGFSASLIQKKDASDTDFSTIFYCSFAVSLICYGAIYFASPFIADFFGEPLLLDVTRVYGISLLISSFNAVQQAYVSRKMIFKKFYFSTLFGTLGSGLLGIVSAFMGFGVWALVAQSMSNLIINSIVLLLIVPWRPKLLFSRESAKHLMSYGWKVLLADLMGTVCDNLRSLLLGKFYTSADLAYFNKGQSFPDLICNNVSTSLNQVMFPAMANVGNDGSAVRAILRKSMQCVSFVMFPALFLLAIVAEPLVSILLTDKWLPCVEFIQVIAVLRCVEVVSGQNIQALKAIGRSDEVLLLEFKKKPIFIVTLILGAMISTRAVAVSWLIYAVYAALVNMRPNSKLLKYSYRDQLTDLAPSFVLAFVAAVPTCALSLIIGNSIILLFVQCLLYLVVFLLLAALVKNEAFTYLKTLVCNLLCGGKGAI